MKTVSLLLVTAVLAVAWLQGRAIAQDPAEQALPEGTGVFYKSPSGFVALRTAPPVQAKGKGGIFTPPRATLLFAGPKASTRISEARPTFYVKQMGWDERTCALLRLVSKESSRELPMGGRTLAAKEQYVIPITTKVVAMNPAPMEYPIFAITPLQNLEPGEYLIAYNTSSSMAHEFGVTEKTTRPGDHD